MTTGSPGSASLVTVVDGLRSTPTAPLPFMSGVVVRSYVLGCSEGPVIVYNSPGIDQAAREIQALGQPSRLLVNHWHEAMYGAPELDVPVFVHQRDRAQTEPSLPVRGTFTQRGMIGTDLEVIPTPGHTAGATMFLWDNGAHRFLFTGDSIWTQQGEWKVVVLGESNRAAYLETLTMVRDLSFDILVPWVAEEGEPFVEVVGRQQARQRISAIIERVRAGANE